MAKSVVDPRIKGFICTTAHPVGCAAHVREQVAHVRKQKPIEGVRNVLVIGASTGYGLASRIAAAFGANANTVGVYFERPAQGDRTASAGWYNTVAFNDELRKNCPGVKSININGDAFSDVIKTQVIEAIKKSLGKVDLVVYSLASPRRTHPKTGQVFHSVLKPTGQTFQGKTVNTDRGIVHDVTIDPATEEEIAATVAVMGGEDWQLWMEALHEAGVLAQGARTVAYSYIGPELTWAIYKDGTIGRAKADLDLAVQRIRKMLKPIQGQAFISVNKAVVTQASSAIPVVPLYISLLFKVMKQMHLHEGCIEQMHRLFSELYGGKATIDEAGRIRMDDRELREDVQVAVAAAWPALTTENLHTETDYDAYIAGFLKLFGFGFPDVDYAQPVETELEIGDENG
ncbi:MAG: trans-2-enoyl-CoA reductase family protein [Puniceicoccales bacterium]|jgi:enoyl-[acyl-carrier protein] reductase/trans-2-enoyl-CoA reductase (NAD+)|nr:trans-2-enoyl-CoA reductase family protein [Puniceicoccales bacterium]